MYPFNSKTASLYWNDPPMTMRKRRLIQEKHMDIHS